MTDYAPEAGCGVEDWWRGERRTVAYVDILGFKTELMKADSQPEELPRLVEALLGGLAGPVSSADEDGGGLLEQFDPDRQQTFFSDCAIVSGRCVPGGSDDVLEVVLDYARHLLWKKFVLRGGIARGLLVHRGSLVVGPAVLKAYLMEQDAARYPRILVEDEIAADFLEIQNSPNDIATIRQSEDGLYFVDVLTTLGLRAGGAEVLGEARELILSRLAEGGPLTLQAKWRWLAGQYNRARRCVEAKGSASGELPEEIRSPAVPDLR